MEMTEGEAERILMRAGLLTDVLAGQKLAIMRGDIVRVSFAFDYRGPAQPVTPYASIGKITLGIFDEIAYATGPAKSLTKAYDWLGYTGYVDIDTSLCSPETNYDIYVKLKEYPSQLVEIADVIDVLGAAEFRNFAITEYIKLA